MRRELCPNCQSAKHGRCCARCGQTVRGTAQTYCSRACEANQAREDRISADQEDHNVWT